MILIKIIGIWLFTYFMVRIGSAAVTPIMRPYWKEKYGSDK